MEQDILISYLNDFIFCPASIYFHQLYGKLSKELYQNKSQIDGTNAHQTIDNKRYSTSKYILQGIDIYSEQFGIQGKIDTFNMRTGLLTERKNKILKIYEGYIFQVYAQFYALTEMHYNVKKIKMHSIVDNKSYDIKLPNEDNEMDYKFKKLVQEIQDFRINKFIQTNKSKCEKCIYEPSCDRSLL